MNFLLQNLEYLIGKAVFHNDDFSGCTGIAKDRLKLLISGKESPLADELIAISRYTGRTIDELLKQNLAGIASPVEKIKFLVMDVDGVLTDGGVFYTENGDAIKKFNTRDGMGIKELVKKGFPVGIISASFSIRLVEKRAKDLGIQKVYIGDRPKAEVLTEWCNTLGISSENIGYIGDDLNDILIMKNCGFSACPSDAANAVKAVADVILTKRGGKGCVREFIDVYVPVKYY